MVQKKEGQEHLRGIRWPSTSCSASLLRDSIIQFCPIIGMVSLQIQCLIRASQQRDFAYQIFELHRLIEVQKGIALSPRLASSDKPVEPAVPPKILPSDNPVVAVPNVSKGESAKPGHKDELPVQKSVGKPSISAAENGGNSQAPSISSKHTPPGSGASNQTQPWAPVVDPIDVSFRRTCLQAIPGNSLFSPFMEDIMSLLDQIQYLVVFRLPHLESHFNIQHSLPLSLKATFPVLHANHGYSIFRLV